MHYFKVVRNIFFIVLCLMVFLLPAKIGTSFGIMLLGVLWLLDYDYKKKWNNLIQKKLWIPLALMAGYFLAHLISMLYTENLAEGWFVLQKKLLFVLAPLLLLTMPDEIQTPRHFRALAWSFLAGCFAVTIASLLSAAIQYFQTSDATWFYYCKVSPFQHPSYMAMYIVFSLAILATLIERTPKSAILIYASSAYAIFSIVYIVLLQSKAGLLSLILLLIFLMIFAIVKKNRSMQWYAVMVVLLSIGAFLLIPSAGSRMQESVAELNDEEDAQQQSSSSTSARLLVWNQAWPLAKQHWLGGVGVGDTQDELNQRYSAAGMEHALSRGYNCHSQILQTAVTLGLVGILILMALFVYPLFTFKRNAIWPLVLFFLMLVGVNILVEAMWETIAGVSFFTLGYTILNSEEWGVES